MDKFVIKTEDFKDVCSKILTAVDSTELSLVTETLELIIKEGVLHICVTNREYYAEVKLPVSEDIEFHATVNATLFLKLIAQITTETIGMSADENSLVIHGNGTYKLPLIYDGADLLVLPKIEIENKTKEFTISSDILNSILIYNSKELTKGLITQPIQKMYYVDENGAITFINGACVNKFKLSEPIKILLNNRLVKLFKLFKDGDVSFTLGYDPISDDIIQTKVKFETPTISITSILSCDDTLINKVPVAAIRGRANNMYPYSVNVNKSALLQTINRINLFNDSKGSLVKTYGIFEFTKDSVIIYDADRENKEIIKYNNDTSNIEETYEMKLKLDDLKTTLETCNEPYLCLNFGDHQAVVLTRGNVTNVIPEVRLA